MTDPKAIDRSVNAVEAAIAKLQGTRKTVDITAADRLMWKMPGILLAIVFFVMIGFAAFLWFLPDDEWYGHFSVKLRSMAMRTVILTCIFRT